MSAMKTCSKCKALKSREDFNRSRSSPDGLFPQCRKCHNAGSAASKAKRPEAVRARRKAYYQRVKDTPEFKARKKAQAEAYREKNLEAIRATVRRTTARWRAEHPEGVWLDNYRTRAKAAGFQPVVEHFLPGDVTSRYGDSCFYCEKGDFEQLDHYVPISAGGPHTLKNVRPSCASCNYAKRATPGDEWLAERSAS